jgi:hypothetical protein
MEAWDSTTVFIDVRTLAEVASPPTFPTHSRCIVIVSSGQELQLKSI